jgi:uncharacterized membrane protein SirB2
MALVEWYWPIRHTHVSLVGASALLFAARGLAVLAGQAWPMRAAVRRASVAIDSALLAAAIALWAMLGLHPLRDAWLGSKLVLLVAYIVLGSLALKRAPSRRARALCLVAALAVLATMVSVALTRNPWGWIASIGALP